METAEAWLREGESRRDAKIAAELEAVRAKIPLAAQLLVEQFGASEVVIFGSFAPGGHPGLHSDVDLLVSGLEEMAILRATAVLDRLFCRNVDLVSTERARPEVVQAARATGRRLDAG
jgi:predicted nucleotidyltransferase